MGCPVPAALSQLSFYAALLPLLPCPCLSFLWRVQAHLFWLICQANLSRFICPGCHVLVVLSKTPYPDSPATLVPFHLSSAIMFFDRPVLSFLSRLSCPDFQYWLSDLDILPHRSCPSCRAFFSAAHCPHCPVLSVTSWPSCPHCPV